MHIQILQSLVQTIENLSSPVDCVDADFAVFGKRRASTLVVSQSTSGFLVYVKCNQRLATQSVLPPLLVPRESE
jgi:hypothetical protein